VQATTALFHNNLISFPLSIAVLTLSGVTNDTRSLNETMKSQKCLTDRSQEDGSSVNGQDFANLVLSATKQTQAM
jgi:2-phospho-L-lactate transferase/gluconeogenesis factor (CofD/UPF0052 family)